MFTGLIQAVCKVTAAAKSADAMTLTVELGPLANNLNIGDSVAVNGLCLTAAAINGPRVEFDVSAESLKKSNLAEYTPATAVNIELAMLPTDRFGGHFVQGHIDGTATVAEITQKGRFWQMRFSADPELLKNMVPKGSVALNGISLTIAELAQNGFTIAVIPQTWQSTNLSSLKVADHVNIETDIIIKTVNQKLNNLLAQKEPPKENQSRLSEEKLKQAGF